MNHAPARPASSRNHWRKVVVLLVILLSAWIQSRVVGQTIVDHPVRADAVHYVSYAWNLQNFHVFSRQPTWAQGHRVPQVPVPDKMTLPGYPAFLALMLDGHPDQAFLTRVTTVQMLLGVLTCVLTLMLALRLVPFPWAVIAGLLTATSPHLATIGTYLLTESLFTVLLTASLYALVRAAQAPGALGWHALAGLLIGATSLVRPQLQALPLILVALCLLPSLRPRLRPALLGFACFALVLAPWQIRNMATPSQADDPNLLVATLYHGSFPDMMYEGNPASRGAAYRFDPQAQTHSSSLPAILTHIGDQFRHEPAKFLRWYLVGKPATFLSWGLIAGGGAIFIYPVAQSPYLTPGLLSAIASLNHALHWPLVLLALGGGLLALCRPANLPVGPTRKVAWRLLGLILVFVIAMHAIGAPYPRYGIPFRPLIYLLAAASCAALARGIGRRLAGHGALYR